MPAARRSPPAARQNRESQRDGLRDISENDEGTIAESVAIRVSGATRAGDQPARRDRRRRRTERLLAGGGRAAR